MSTARTDPSLPKHVGGTVNGATGALQINFGSAVSSTVWAKLQQTPLILANYQDADLVYTSILNAFDD